MLSAIDLGEFLPDLAPSKSGHLIVAKNVLPIANGYAPVGDLQTITPIIGSAGELFSGGGAYVASDGTAILIAATPSRVRYYASGVWTTIISVATTGRWNLTQFGDNIVMANGGTLLLHDIVSGVGGTIIGSPTATDVATVRDFIVALQINADQLMVGWSGFNDATDWPLDGTNQSDTQPLLSGGKGVRIVGGEYGIILQQFAIKRMTYVGGEAIFQFDEISSEIGCMAEGSVAVVGKMIFFWSERGPMMCDGQTVTPIGDEKIKKWFFSRFSREDMANMWAAIDPRNSVVMWAMPGRPGTILAYNWVLQRFSTVELALGGIFTGFTANTSLEGVDILYPTGIDNVPISLDDAFLAGGNPLLLVVNADSEVGALTGTNLEATFRLGNIEPSPGKRSRIRSLRPVTDATSATATINARMRAGDAENIVSAGSMRDNGKMPIRANGRYNDITLGIPAGEAWTYIQGLEIEFERGDGR